IARQDKLECRNVGRHRKPPEPQILLHSVRNWSNLALDAYLCKFIQVPDLLTTEEAAAYLRLSERKLYELVATVAVRGPRVTGKWLFPKAALARWLGGGLVGPFGLAHPQAPPIVGGSHDPLLEWSLHESGSQLASLAEGSEAGLNRLARGEVMAAAIHLHQLDGDDDRANVDAVAVPPGLHDAVLIGFARPEPGLVVAAGHPPAPGD